MAAEYQEVKLHGFWASPFSHRVLWALKIKGIQFDYIEEDLPNNKSELLLKYNPIHKKVPVLVHCGKPIVESDIILEYIEETWPQNPLLPADPYEKAQARFWIKFIETMTSPFITVLATSGVEQEKAAKELIEALKILEEKALGEKKFFGGDEVNMVDVAYGFTSYWFKNIEQVVGIKLVEPKTLPRLHEWGEDFVKVPLLQENHPDLDKMLAYMTSVRERYVPKP